MQCTDLEVKMNEHENGQTYEKYGGNTKRARHENAKYSERRYECTQTGKWMNVNMKMMMIDERRKGLIKVEMGI